MQQAMQHRPRAALPAAAFEPVCRIMNMGSYAFESMAKATRQVTSFAGTNLGNAAIHACNGLHARNTVHAITPATDIIRKLKLCTIKS